VLIAFWYGNLKERDDLEGLDVNGVNVKMSLKEIGLEHVYWIYDPVNMDQWRWTVLNMAMNLRVKSDAENFVTV